MFRRIDGHAPGLSGKALGAYRLAGVSTDHECSTFAEALELSLIHILEQSTPPAPVTTAVLPDRSKAKGRFMQMLPFLFRFLKGFPDAVQIGGCLLYTSHMKLPFSLSPS